MKCGRLNPLVGSLMMNSKLMMIAELFINEYLNDYSHEFIEYKMYERTKILDLFFRYRYGMMRSHFGLTVLWDEKDKW
jgi:hypothetical protein